MTNCLILLATFCCGETPPSANLVKNPGFEDSGAGSLPAHWSGRELGHAGGLATIDTSIAHSGQRSLRLGIKPNTFVTCSAARISVKPNKKYFLAYWCKTQGCKRARAYAFFQTNKAQQVLADVNQYGTQDWTTHLAEYTTAADELWLQPVLVTHDTGSEKCWCWFDDVEVFEGAFPEPLASQWNSLRRAAAGISDTAVILAKNAEAVVWCDNLAAKIYREDGIPSYAKPVTSYDVAAARNEEVFFQVSITPTRDLADVALLPQGFAGPGRISSSSVRWWNVGYANIKNALRPETRLGLTPDPLLNPAPVTAPKNLNTTFCVGIRVPTDTVPGAYRGVILVKTGNRQLAELPVALRVYGFALPKDPTFRTLITYSSAALRSWDKRPPDQVETDICRVLYEHGIRGCGATVVVAAKIVDGKVVCDFRGFDNRLSLLSKNLGCNAFFLGPMFGGGTSEGWEAHRKWLGLEPLSPEFNQLFPQYLRQVAAHLREKGWLDRAYLYLWDEPERDYFDKVVALQKLALQADPGFKIWETTSPNYEAFWGVVKAWSVPFSRPYFDEETVDARRRASEEIWVYNIPASLEGAPLVHRLWFWQAARYGAVGAQLWNVTWYHGINPWEEITPKPYPTGRGKKNLYHYRAGQALMLYPNPKGPGAPLSCLRLKLLQKGIDDFEYLAILQAKLAQSLARKGARDPKAEAQQRMRALSGKLVKDIGQYVLDWRTLEQVRAEVARQIEAAAP